MPSTLIELARERAQRAPEELLYTFLEEGSWDEQRLTYGELDRRARALASRLQAEGAAGERALLLYPPGLDYITAFFGCLYAGVVAVPAYPPDPSRLQRMLPRLQAIATDAGARFVLTNSFIASMAEGLFEYAPDMAAMRWVATDSLEPGLEESWRAPSAARDDLAFLQYTSGSTGTPKGVMLSHGHLLHNSELITRAFETTEQSVGVIWLPPYHDMGLIGGILQPLYRGFPVVLMSPLDFLSRPVRWVQAISRYGATVSGGPNFAFELCVRKSTPEERAALDLRSWRLAFSGAEPVSPATVDRFCEAFGAVGFRRQSIYPCYGLAEATLLVSGGELNEPPVARSFDAGELGNSRAEPVSEGAGRLLVGCGRAREGLEVVIVHPERGTPCGPGEVGEIWIAGGSVAAGYWRRPEETQRQFQARLPDGQGPYLRSGDLGFLDGRELYIAGRLKDLIIIRGRNHYPQDIERAVERSHPALRPGCCAAFSVTEAGEERLVVVQEVDPRRAPDLEEVASAIRRAVQEENELHVHALVLLGPGAIPKTTSGKIQRHASRQGFLEGSLEELSRSTFHQEPGSAEAPSVSAAQVREASGPERVERLAAHLRGLVARALQMPEARVDVERPVHGFGLDSLMAVEVVHALEQGLGLEVSMTGLLADVSLRQLAERLAPGLDAPTSAPAELARPSRALSHGQEALWFLQQMAPESAAYNVSCAAWLRTAVDVAALRAAFDVLVKRHPVLRTVYPVRGGVPGPEVRDEPVHFEHVEAAGLDDAALERKVSDEAHRPFDLARGPIFRVRLFSRSPEEHVLLLVVHHVAADLWSLVVLLSELRQLYPAQNEGKLPPAPCPYGDFVTWQERLLAGEQGAKQRAYWLQQLSGELPVLSLPSDKPAPAVLGSAGAGLRFRLNAELTGRLKALAHAEGTTLYTVLLGAFQLLLSRSSGQQEVLVGSPVAGRSRAGFDPVVGYFVNPLVLRADLSGAPSFRGLLEQVRRRVLDALDHPDYPFYLLAKELQSHREPGRSPLIQAMFVLQRPHARGEEELAGFVLGEPGATVRLGELPLESFPLAPRTAPFELSLMMVEASGGLSGQFQYSTELFEPARVERLARQWEVLLEEVVARPGERIDRLALMKDLEREAVLELGRGASCDYPREASLGEVFAQQARSTPEAIALVCGRERVSYAELDERANGLAHRLCELGVRPEDVVGLAVERGVELVVGMLGALKAGAAYMPLDLGLPRERLRFMLEETRPRVVLAPAARLGELEGVRGAAVEELTRLRASAPPRAKAHPESVANILFTSGSTGRPKAVAVLHRGVIHLARNNYASLTPHEVLLQWSTPLFDASTFETWGALLNGARLVVSPPGVASLEEVGRLIAAEGVNTVLMTAALFRQMVDHQLEGLRPVRQLLAGGDAMSPAHARRLLDALPGTTLINAYGPTENACITCCYTLPRDSDPRRGVPLGSPLADTDVYVLDASLEPVPPGVVGELYTGGDGLARGYVGRPELTAERFVPHPFSQQPGARLYRTGDLARYRLDGSLEFMGRADAQVKVRGFRIELEEIEAVLTEHPAVRDAAVLAQGSTAEDKRLVAFVVAREATAPGPEELRSHLGRLLPEYMVPSAFVALEALPLTSNGKLDRKALLARAPQHGAHRAEYVAPRTPTEARLAEVLAEVLSVPRVGLHDDFFALGGHSLLATRAAARIQEVLGVSLPIRAFFEAPTLEKLAERLSGTGAAPPPSIQRVSRTAHRMKLSQLSPVVPASGRDDEPKP